jgi:FixJ family two-component response regulator
LSGLDLQHELANTDPPIPIVFITAHGDIPMTVQALKAGGFVTSSSSTAFSCRLIGAAQHDINRASWLRR